MNAPQAAKLNMYNAVISHLQSQTAAVDSLPALKRGFSLFVAKVAAINAVAPKEAEGSTGESLTKEQARKNLVDMAQSVASLMYAWASETGNESIKAQTDLSASDLDRLKDSMLPERALSLQSLATENKAALADFGISDTLLQSLADAIADFKAVVASPRNKIAARTTQGKNLSALFTEADSILKNQVAKLMPGIKKVFPDVAATFLANSKIVDAAGISAKEKAAKAAKAKEPAAAVTNS